MEANRTYHSMTSFKWRWVRFWMRFAGLSTGGRIATYFATWLAPPHKASTPLAKMYPHGYISPTAIIHHSDLQFGNNVLIGDRVIVYQAKDGGSIELGHQVCILRDTAVETGHHGSLSIGEKTWIQPRCQLNAYMGDIQIGSGVDIAPNCAFYSYDHGHEPDEPIRQQKFTTKGPIEIGDHAWLGVGVIVLSGVHIGNGAVVGAGSVVTKDIPDNAIAFGMPARVIKMRSKEPNKKYK